MKLRIQAHAFTIAIVMLATVVVVVLGVLQYRWSDQISETTSIRLADSLQMSMINWHLDFLRDLSEICSFLRDDSEVDAHADWNRYARRLAEWRKASGHPDLISDAFVLIADQKVLRFDSAKMRFEPAIFPSRLDELRFGLHDASLSLQSQLDKAPGDTASIDQFFSNGSLQDWRFEPRVPALVRPFIRTSSRRGDDRERSTREVDWIVIVLSEPSIRNRIFPDLAQRYFQGTDGLDYKIAVVVGKKSNRVIYSSDPPFGSQEVADADGTMNVFGRPQDDLSGSSIRIFHPALDNKGPSGSLKIPWFPLLANQNEDQDWRLVVRHRRGGALGSFVADSRRRDLALSFGILSLLVISMAILITTSIRAQGLAKLQMDFVTAVSHELRSPVTVISSAAENISQGIIEGNEHVQQYGIVIGAQAKKLSQMIEQILMFASIRGGRQRYNLRPLDVSEILDAALSNTAELIQAAGFHVEQTIQPNLPQVLGDLSALSQCFQNLITNALKYGGEQSWIGIDAKLLEKTPEGRFIRISVSDRGLGISSEDLQHIFEPFFRSAAVTAAQIHGTGLGLPLAKSIAEAMKGNMEVVSVFGKGSTFMVHLPCLEHTADRESENLPLVVRQQNLNVS